MIRLALLTLLLLIPPAFAQGEPFALEPLGGGLYRFSSGNYRSVVWVSDEGVVVIDPISTEAATWLQREVARRFEQPVRYVIYSHNHPDHVYGGEVFSAPGVTFVAHELAAEDLRHTKARAPLPQVTFTDGLTLRLGERTLRLRYHGVNNGRGSVSLHFEAQRVMFVVDWIVVGRMPYGSLAGYDIEGMIRSTREVLALDWETFVGGHAAVGTRDDVRAYLRYLESLYDQVRDGMLAGETLEQIKAKVSVPHYAETPRYAEWLPMNAEAVYRTLADRSYLSTRPDVAPQGE